jgi:hypothetical protein
VLEARALRTDQARRAASLPAAFVPLLELHWAVATGRPRQAAHAARQAQRLGVSKAHLIGTAGFGALYADEFALAELAEELKDVLDGWPSGSDGAGAP